MPAAMTISADALEAFTPFLNQRDVLCNWTRQRKPGQSAPLTSAWNGAWSVGILSTGLELIVPPAPRGNTVRGRGHQNCL